MFTHHVPVTRDSSVVSQSVILNHFLGTPSNNGRQVVFEVYETATHLIISFWPAENRY